MSNKEELVRRYEAKKSTQTIEERKEAAKQVKEFFPEMKDADVERFITEGILNK